MTGLTREAPQVDDVELRRREGAYKVTRLLGMPPHRMRLLVAVHEAGHALVAHTAGFRVIKVRVTSRKVIGLHGDDVATIDYEGVYPNNIVPLSDVLAISAAGFQATCMWMQGRGLDFNTPPFKTALNIMAGGDIANSARTSRDAGDPDRTMQDGMLGAARVLKRRWHATLRLAYALTHAGELSGPELDPYLYSYPAQACAARAALAAWRRETDRLWRVGGAS